MSKDDEIKSGDKFYNRSGNYIKVMAVVDGYLMIRWAGSMPFVESIKDFNKRISMRALTKNVNPTLHS